MLIQGQRVAGVVLLVVMLLLLRDREHYATHSLSTKIKSADLDVIDPALEGQLIAVHGNLISSAPVGDPDFIKPGGYIALYRKVYTFAKVTRTRRVPVKVKTKERVVVDGKTKTKTVEETEYQYEDYQTDDWELDYPESSTLTSQRFFAHPTKLGAYEVDAADLEFEALNELTLSPVFIEAKHQDSFQPSHNAFFFGEGTPNAPQKGDLRVVFQAVTRETALTIIGRQSGAAIVPYEYTSSEVAGRSDSEALLQGPLLRAVPQTLDELLANEQGSAKPDLWAARLLIAFFMLVALGFLVWPRQSGETLLLALKRVGVSLIVYSFAMLIVVAALFGTSLLPAIAFGGGIAAMLIGAVIVTVIEDQKKGS